MTDQTQPRPWDLEQYSVQARQERRRERAEELATAAVEGGGGKTFIDETITEKDDGDWLAPAKQKQRPRFVESGSIFWIAFTGAILSVLTLGLYRFWMITNLRRAYCGSIRVDGDAIEYTGTGFEKLIGFLVAVALLAVYLGIANVLLLFGGLVALEGNSLLLPFSLIAMAPFLFWAQYRGQRYLMARLRWRGIRFGLGPGAWGYTVRSLLWGIGTLMTAGLLYPYMHFKQAQYITNRASFGSIPMRQNGTWLGLLAYWIWFYISGGLIFLLAWGLAEEMRLGEQGIGIMLSVFTPFALLLFFIMFINYQIGSFRYLWDNREVGDSEINNEVSTGTILWTYIKGSFAAGFLSLIVSVIAGIVLAGGGYMLTTALSGGVALDQLTALPPEVEAMLASDEAPTLDVLLAAAPALMTMAPFVIGLILAYVVMLTSYWAFGQSLVTQPILRHKVEAMLIHNPGKLSSANQRAHDKAGEAGGFADALGVDVGAGFG